VKVPERQEYEVIPLRAPFRREVRLPGSKSLAARAAVAACLSEGVSELRGDTSAGDVQVLLDGLEAFGARVARAPRVVRVEAPQDSAGDVSTPRSGAPSVTDVNAGESGTAARFLLAFAAGRAGETRLDGEGRLRERPMGPLAACLRRLAAPGFELIEEGRPGCVPMRVRSSGLQGGACELDASESSQFLSALLLAGSAARTPVDIGLTGPLVSAPYVALTLEVARVFAIGARRTGPSSFRVEPGRGRAAVFEIEPDAASAGYACVAAAITGGEAAFPGLPRASRQPEMALLGLLERMGCTVHDLPGSAGFRLRGPASGSLRGIEADLRDAPDSLPALAVAALFAAGPSLLTGAAHLRLKESDRLSALAAELGRLGARIEEREDGLAIHPPGDLRGAPVSSHGDHRIAMSLAVAGLRIPGIRLSGPDCVAKSFPGFWTEVIC
jgi:3-phosphoshikimate 1-carboxyvinyltransferase